MTASRDRGRVHLRAAGMDVAVAGAEAAAVLLFLLVLRFVPKNLAHLLLAALQDVIQPLL